jgi:hypothetical protein
VGVVSVWLIVFVVIKFADRRLPWILALGLTYGMAAYVILPRAVRNGPQNPPAQICSQLHDYRRRIARRPVNLVLIGTLQQLRAAFLTVGWLEADRLGPASSWRMIRAFVFNSPYPTAPFSTLYLFGRGQDIGFQNAIDNSPRKRHHIRFWALSLAQADGIGTASFWLNTDRPPDDARVLWVGAGTRDTGFSLTDLSGHLRHGFGYECRAGLHHCRAERQSSHRGCDILSIRPTSADETREPLRHRWGNYIGDPGGG